MRGGGGAGGQGDDGGRAFLIFNVSLISSLI